MSHARTAGAVLTQYRSDWAPLLQKAAQAAEFIYANYSNAIEKAETMECRRQITQG
jgi:hypothetical protein